MTDESITQLPDDSTLLRPLIDLLAEANPLKADGLDLCGEILLETLHNTGDEPGRAIKAYIEATSLEDDPRLGGFLDDVANAYQARYERFGLLDDLEKAITIRRNGVAITAEGDADLASRLNSLGISYLRRFERKGDMQDVSEAIKLHQCAVQLTPDGHADLPARLNHLGNSFLRRFERNGNMQDISEAIQHNQHAVQLSPDGHPNLPSSLNGLGISYLRRFEGSGDMKDISEAIKYVQHAVQLAPDGHPKLPTWLNNLGFSFSCRFEQNEDMQDILEAIQHQTLAVQLTPDGHPDLPVWLNNLGTSYSRRFQHNRDMQDISEAIRYQQRVVQLAPDGHPGLPSWLTNLGNSFLLRFEWNGDMQDISEAIQHQQRAVQLTPKGHADLPGFLDNLGLSLSLRFEWKKDIQDISEAIRHQQRAVQLAPDGHARLPSCLSNIGISFLRRFEHNGDMEDISEAIRHQQHAVQLAPDGHASLPMRLNNLGLSFSSHFKRTGDMQDISQAIQHHQHAVLLTPDGHAAVPSYLHDLGNSYRHRFERNQDMNDISEAIRHQQRGIQLAPYGHAKLASWLNSLGMSFLKHFELTKEYECLQSAVENFRLSATSSFGSPSVRLTAAKSWATTVSQPPFFSPSELLKAHSCITRLLSLISGFENTVQRRHETLVDASQLSLAASAAALSLGHPDVALEWLMEGRCIVWNQINQLRTPVDELRSFDPALAEHFSVLSRKLETAGLRTDPRSEQTKLSMEDSISLEDEARVHLKHAKEWEALLKRIRNIPRFKDFLQPRKYPDIMDGLPEGPTIIINIHSDRCDALALIAGAEQPLHIPLPNFSYKEAERLANGLCDRLLSFGIRSPRAGRQRFKNLPPSDLGIDFPVILKALWSNVVSPILEVLALPAPDSDAKLPRIWWCPTGPLAVLPIHAAGIYEQGKGIPGQYLAEFAVSSYTPTVNVRNLSDSVKGCQDAAGLLMVSQSNTPGEAKIPFARDEVGKIEKQLGMRGIPSSTLNDGDATVNRVLEAMEKFPSIHLACHASQHMETPLKSSILLHDGPLELSEIMKKNLRSADFAFLSACQTSKGATNLPDEVVHLASGMLTAGYQSVVGTMWSVLDKHGPDLAEVFYEKLLEDTTDEGPRINGSQAARALHYATNRLRENLSASPDSFLAWVPYIHLGI